jgi:hypothetical protein
MPAILVGGRSRGVGDPLSDSERPASLMRGSLRIGVLVSISAPRQDECLICVNIETIIAQIATEAEIGSIIFIYNM